MTTTYLATLADVGAGIASGTSMPGSPSNGDLFYRTDHDMIFRYRSSGTRWVCTCPHDYPFVSQIALVPLSATQGNWSHLPLPVSRGLDVLVEAYEASFYVAAGASALGASHKWVGTIQIRGTGTTVGTLTIDSGANDTWRNVSDTTDDVVDVTSAEFALSMSWTKTGTPGNLVGVACQVTWRYIGV